MTTVICTHCGAPRYLGHFNNITVGRNGGMNIAVECEACGEVFEAAPVDGTYMDVGGRLMLVRAMVHKLETGGDDLSAEEIVEDLERLGPTFAPLVKWAKDHQDLVISSLIAILLFVLSQVLQAPDAGVSPDQIQEIIDNQEEGLRETRDGHRGENRP